MALRYVYQLSLANGKVLINESDGLFSINSPTDPDDKILINSAVLIKVYEQEAQPEQAAPDGQIAPQGQTSIVEESSAE